jgi:lipopolysaccharide export system protein LptA
MAPADLRCRLAAFGLTAVLVLPLAAHAQETALDIAGEAPIAPAAVSTAPAASGGGLGFGDDSTPFELSADQGIEFRSADKTYTARGNAVASQGSSSIAGDTLVFYTGADDSFERILATGHVKVASSSSTGYGERGDYDASQKLLVLSGGDLRLDSEGDVLTARDRIEYWSGENAVIAYGEAVLVRDDTRISGDKAVLYFAPNAEGKDELSQVEATGKVKVNNGKQTIFGDNFAYKPDTDIAVVTGNVVIVDGANEYRGARAEIDNKNKVSRLLAGEGKRVHTFIKPKSSSEGSAAQ